MFDRLRAHQDQAERVMARAEWVLRDRVPDPQALGQARWELARVLRGYQIYKHTEIFDPIIATAGGAAAALAQRLKAECVRQGDAFLAHVSRWSGGGVVEDIDGYRTATLALFAKLRAHIVHERVGVDALEAYVRDAPVRSPPMTPPDRRGEASRPVMRY